MGWVSVSSLLYQRYSVTTCRQPPLAKATWPARSQATMAARRPKTWVSERALPNAVGAMNVAGDLSGGEQAFDVVRP